jgi:hypothetical protein
VCVDNGDRRGGLQASRLTGLQASRLAVEIERGGKKN